MAKNSNLFDSIRISGTKGRKKKTEPEAQVNCEWKDCTDKGTHPAPKGQGYEGEYFRFCMKHVREYNKQYNFFRNMSEEEAEKFRASIVTGHRPTWKSGSNAHARKVRHVDASEWGMNGTRNIAAGMNGRKADYTFEIKDDPFNLFGEEENTGDFGKPKRALLRLEKKHLATLGFEEATEGTEVKQRFKELVKKLHPDLNGGEGSEEKLKEVIQAYNYLKQAGLCP